MLKKHYIFLLPIILCSFGCNGLLFESPMPKKARELNKLSKELLGTYLQLDYSSYDLEGAFIEIRKDGKQQYIIEREEVVYMADDSPFGKIGLGIDTVEVVGDEIRVFIGDTTHVLSVFDTIMPDKKTRAARIDFEKNNFVEFHRDREEAYRDSVISKEMKLLYDKGAYFLNTKFGDEYWLVRKIKLKDGRLGITETSFDLKGKNKLLFEEMKAKYKIERVALEEGESKPKIFFANPTNVEFEEIIKNENGLFHSAEWIKIKGKGANNSKRFSSPKMPYIIVGGILMLVLLIVGLKKRNSF